VQIASLFRDQIVRRCVHVYLDANVVSFTLTSLPSMLAKNCPPIGHGRDFAWFVGS
jgi:hypothetical protein